MKRHLVSRLLVPLAVVALVVPAARATAPPARARHPPTADRGFAWRDAAIGAAAAAGSIFVLAGVAVVLMRRRTPGVAL